MNKYRSLLLASVLFLLTGCSEPEHGDEVSEVPPSPQTLSGEVFYRERIYVPPGAKLHITLKDVPRAGEPATLVAGSTILLAGSQPYQFTLDYSPADIDATIDYALRAEITFYDDLLFTSATQVDPFKQPEGKIAIRVTPVGAPAP